MSVYFWGLRISGNFCIPVRGYAFERFSWDNSALWFLWLVKIPKNSESGSVKFFPANRYNATRDFLEVKFYDKLCKSGLSKYAQSGSKRLARQVSDLSRSPGHGTYQ